MDIFIARQPIFNRKQEVFGYELLFRNSRENFFNFPDPDKAASRLIGDSTITFGIESLTRGKRAFLNITRDSLINEYPSLLPIELTVLEVLESVEPDKEVIQACRNLKKKGYTIALDDFVYRDCYQPMVDIIDLIKVDFLTTSPAERKALYQRFAPKGKRFLAEKVETQEEYQEALNLGYHYFQGFFFSRPVMLSKRNLSGNKLSLFRVLKEIHKPGMDFKELENIIKQDLTLSYKLMRYINSAFFGLHSEVRSIKHALVLLGEAEIKKWATLVSLTTMGEEKPLELMVNAAIRGKMCEALGTKMGMKDKASDFFLMGLFSVIDAILDCNLAEVLRDLPLAHELKRALMRVTFSRYRAALEIVLAYEKGDWAALAKWSNKIGAKEAEIPKIYLDSVKWANQVHR